MYSQTTRSIIIDVTPVFLEEESSPEDNRYVWAYQIRIENSGTETVHLRRRYWRIVDGYGHVETVDGEGVIGVQPVLKPGAVFTYVSGVPLRTPSGIMNGRYRMRTETGEVFDVTIPAFSLDCPHGNIRLN